jgi:hypothetical protein
MDRRPFIKNGSWVLIATTTRNLGQETTTGIRSYDAIIIGGS